MAVLSAAVRRVRVGGQTMVAKVGPGVLDESAGLRRLAVVTGGPCVPAVLYADDTLLVTEWVEPGPRTKAGERALGSALAVLHGFSVDAYGGGSGWIGGCAVDTEEAADAATFYGRRLNELAARCGLASQVAPMVARLEELVPPSGPVLVHGDLWWGNVLWGRSDRAWVIDPSVHGGHPEEDLAMLGLFGPVPETLVDAYLEVCEPVDGWRDRTALFQLYPLLVHAVLFGGSYLDQAAAVAARYR